MPRIKHPSSRAEPSRSRRRFLQDLTCSSLALAGASASQLNWFGPRIAAAQTPGDRPPRCEQAEALNPRERVPVSLIIDDSTCLVNLNRYAMPQFDAANAGQAKVYHRDWRAWPEEIPDRFVRKFGEWSASAGVKGKYSIVPYPACVGRIDRMLPGWTAQELTASLDLVRTVIAPNWDIHPEMVTHTRVIDLATGHPYPELSLKYMENWDWSVGRSSDEIAAYMAYALNILKNVGLPCEGVTTPGGFGSRSRPALAAASLQAVRDVFGAEVPHYFRDLYADGEESVAPRVELASGLDGPNPQCVVSIVGCTGDWTGGWDCTPPVGVDRFISPDLREGRLVDVIGRGEPAIMVCHWTGIYFNGEETGFEIFRQVVERLRVRYDHLVWMKLSEIARYWAAKELTRLAERGEALEFQAPFACAEYTLRWRPSGVARLPNRPPRLMVAGQATPLREVDGPLRMAPGAFRRDSDSLVACISLPKGESRLEL